MPSPANLLDWDYLERAAASPPPHPITDVHTHLHGREAVACYRDVAAAFGVEHTWSMTHLDEMETVRGILGDRVSFIAVPDYRRSDERLAVMHDFPAHVERCHAEGARIAKFFAAPRLRDAGIEIGQPGAFALDAPPRVAAMEAAVDLGMAIMVHVADPDTWFAGRYADAAVYGTKADQYEPLEALLDRFDVPWIAAHMGGWPEDLAFLDGLLSRHPRLHLDTSATKWMIRELSRHDSETLTGFLDRWQGRVLFGSDILTADDHLRDAGGTACTPSPASSLQEATELYASRYCALRTLLETSYEGPSPIEDPDSPGGRSTLRGAALPTDLLGMLYGRAAEAFLASLTRTAV